MKYLVIIIFQFSFFTLVAQEENSLGIEFDVLYNGFRANLSDLDSAEFYARKAVELSYLHNDSINLAISLDYLGWVYAQKNSHDIALRYYWQALNFSRLTRSTIREGSILNHILNTYRSKGVLDSALTYAFMSLERRLIQGDKNRILVAYNNLASIYLELEFLEESIYYYELSLENALDISDTSSIVNTYTNLVTLCGMQEDYDKGDIFLNKAEYICRNRCDDNSEKLIYYHKGIRSIRNQKYQNASFELDQAIQLSQKLKDSYFLSYSYLYMAKLKLAMLKEQEFIRYMNKSLEIASSARLVNIMSILYEELYEYYSSAGNSVLALEYLEKHIAIMDSTQSNKVFLNIDRIHSDQIQKKNDEILAQKELIIQQQEKSNQLLQISGGLALVFIFAMIYNVIIVRKKNRTISLQNDELDIYNEKLLLGLDKRDMELQSTREAIERIISRISHDVRGKVATLKLLSFLAEKENGDDDEYYSKITDTIRDTDSTLAWLTEFSRIKNRQINNEEIQLREFIAHGFPDIAVNNCDHCSMVTDSSLLYSILEAFDDDKKLILIDCRIEEVTVFLSLGFHKKWSKAEFRKWLKYLNSPEDINADVTETLILNRAAIERLGGQMFLEKLPGDKLPRVVLQLPISLRTEREIS